MPSLFEGQPMEMTGMQPEWLEEVAQKLLGGSEDHPGGIAGKAMAGRTATPLPKDFPLTSPVDPLSMMGANIASQYLGQGQQYQPPPFGGFDYNMGPSGASGAVGFGDEPPFEEFDPTVTIGGEPPFEPILPPQYEGPMIGGMHAPPGTNQAFTQSNPMMQSPIQDPMAQIMGGVQQDPYQMPWAMQQAIQQGNWPPQGY
jgi:hypothetical protein